MRARTGAEREDDIRQFLIGAHLVRRCARDIEDLATQRQDGLGLTVARLFCGAACAIAFDKKDFGSGSAVTSAIGKLSRQPQLAGRALARELALLPSTLALLRALDDAVEQDASGARISAEPMIEMIFDGAFDQPRCFGGSQPFLCLALKLRVGD